MCHRFLWQDADGTVQIYQFQRLVSGMKASSYLAGKAVKVTLVEYDSGHSPDVVVMLSQDLYVDDLLTSLPTSDKAIQTRRETQQL